MARQMRTTVFSWRRYGPWEGDMGEGKISQSELVWWGEAESRDEHQNAHALLLSHKRPYLNPSLCDELLPDPEYLNTS